MKLIIFTISLLLFQNQAIDIEKLRKDTVLIKYREIQKELSDGLLRKKYNLPDNYLEIQKKFIETPTKIGLTSSLKNAGMSNAEEYVEKLFAQTALMFEFLRKHPELSKLEYKTKYELFSKLIAP